MIAEKEWLEELKKIQGLTGDEDIRRSATVKESDKQFLKRAHKELLAGNIDPSKYARVVAGLEQGEGIPVEIDVGKISHEDKLKADPSFANYIAQDTKSGYGVEYEDVGIPMQIREDARKYAQQLASGGRVGLEEGTKPITLGSLIIDFIVENNRQPKPSEILQLKDKLESSSK